MELNQIMKPLEPYKSYLNSFGNLLNAASKGSVHALNPATWLSGVRPPESSAGASMAKTLDQVIVDHIGQDTTLPSLQVASETTIQSAACNGPGCYYSSTLSFANDSSPLPMEHNPRKLYLQLFGEGDSALERNAINHQEARLLDMVADSTKSLQKQLGAGDRVILEGYLDTVREIERRVEKAAQRDLTGIEVPGAPIGELDDFDTSADSPIAISYQHLLS